MGVWVSLPRPLWRTLQLRFRPLLQHVGLYCVSAGGTALGK